jgi:2-polyprenyl-3-methyl-5-hydroxy-6-metoxy-1,4-benzoquinol methylase
LVEKKFDPLWFDEGFYRGGKGSIRDKESPFYRQFVNRVLKTYEDKSYEGMRLLDVGCGLGIRTAIYRENKIDAIGFDVSKWAYNNTVLPDFKHFCGDVRSVGGFFEHNSFDLVVAERIMGYVPRQDAAIIVKRLAQMTKRNIIFSIICSDHKSKQRVLSGAPGRINIASKAFWLDCFRKANLKINIEKTAIMCKGGWDCVWFLEEQ